mmetsp:Transcript_61481/g.176344  ORF Transcript_61481/g.176344 Transcript_61481/m.176344 type:complete len:217 (-) Transcript_61481:1072-1722(-)
MLSFPSARISMNLSTMIPTPRFIKNMKLSKIHITNMNIQMGAFVSRSGCTYGENEVSHAAYMTFTQPSVVEISTSASMALKTLSKFWLSTCCHSPPCSTHKAASLIRGVQKSGHSHAAWYSSRQDLHAPDSLSFPQVSAQKLGWISLSCLHLAMRPSSTSGQNCCRQLMRWAGVPMTSAQALSKLPPCRSDPQPAPVFASSAPVKESTVEPPQGTT